MRCALQPYSSSPVCVRSQGASQELAYQLSTTAHEAMHCFGLDHCGLYTCCMNSWCDEVREFSPKPSRTKGSLKYERDEVTGCLHLCPVCLRKLQVTCSFNIRDRYCQLTSMYEELRLDDQVRWCQAVLRIGDDLIRSGEFSEEVEQGSQCSVASVTGSTCGKKPTAVMKRQKIRK